MLDIYINEVQVLFKKSFVKKPVFLLLIYCCYMIISCDRNKPDYYSQIPHIQQFEEIVSIDTNLLTERKTYLSGWYLSKKDSLGLLGLVSDIVQVNKEEVWISDFIKGEVYSFDINGKFKRKILSRGKGPNEIIQPYSMEKYQDEEKTLIYISDAKQKAIIALNKAGNEQFRLYNENIEHRLMEADLKVLAPNSIIFPTYNLKDFALAEFDSLGTFKKGLIPRLIPYGFQPVTYNNVTFDYKSEKDLFVYAYKGLPLIFVETAERKIVFNLEPGKKIEDLNTPLDTKPENTSLSVKKLVRNISLEDDKIFVAYLSHIMEISISDDLSARRYNFLDKETEKPIKFHFVKETDDFLFLIDGYKNNIYRVPKNYFDK